MGAAPRTWLVMLRDLSDGVRVVGMDRISASLILDMDTGLALGHGIGGAPEEALATAVQTALTQAAGPLPPEPPARVLCGPAIAQQVSRHLAEVSRKRGFPGPRVIEVDPVPEGEDIFDSLVGHMSGRQQPAEPPTPADWKLLLAQAHRFAEASPWNRWADSVELAIEVAVGGKSTRYSAVVLGNAAIQHGLVLYPGPGLPERLLDWEEGDELPMPAGTLMFHLDTAEKLPSELVAKAQRYGWPGDADLVPVFLTVAGSEASDPGRVEAQRVSLAIEALLQHDRRGPVMAGAETAGALPLAEGVAGKFRIRQVPDAPPQEEPGTAHLMVHQVGYDLMPPASPVSMGSLHSSALPELRRKSQIHRPGPRPGPDVDRDLPVIVLIPAAGTGTGLAARIAEDDPFAVTIVEHEGKALVTLACARAVHALMELPVDAAALALFRTRMERSSGHHVVLVADEASSQGGGEVYGLFECFAPVGPPPRVSGPKARPVTHMSKRGSKRRR